MKKHPAYGRDVILKAERDVGVRDDAILSMAKDIVYTHHEWWDGSGYPRGLRDEEIPVAGRLMAVVDVYDAAISRALYRQPISHDAVVELIRKAAATHFDPAVVAAFINVAPVFKHLTNGQRDGDTSSDEPVGQGASARARAGLRTPGAA
jgi:HD-GYP domain-containing protein (c-di-GMP phosphodiesterase class II)